jgi:hypothetical protein
VVQHFGLWIAEYASCVIASRCASSGHFSTRRKTSCSAFAVIESVLPNRSFSLRAMWLRKPLTKLFDAH